MDRLRGFTDVTDTRPLTGVEVSILVVRAEAARYGADVSLLGRAVQLLTQGIAVAEYRPSDADGPLGIRVRLPQDERTLAELGSLRVPTSAGLVPISNVVTFAPSERVGMLTRIDEARVVTIEANVAPGVLVNDQITALQAALEDADLPEGVTYAFAGEAEDQTEAMTFLAGAFAAAIFGMLVILVLQFDSFYQAFVVTPAALMLRGARRPRTAPAARGTGASDAADPGPRPGGRATATSRAHPSSMAATIREARRSRGTTA